MSALPLDVRCRVVRWWLLAVAALIVVMVMVGGATRLTESGLSIVEWQPVTGVVPPLTEADWQREFDKYKKIPQYQTLNPRMTLEEFKVIYWWEWVHRLLGRLIGAVFLLPFLWFLWQGWLDRKLAARLWAIFALGALQGVIGWWMVASGLVGRVDVSPYRLAVHLTLACIILVAVLWTRGQLIYRTSITDSFRLRVGAVGLLALVFVQIYMGALVAGLDAGLVFNTWPLMEGRLIPPASELLAMEPTWRNLFENRLTVQFGHRMVAYGLFVLAVLHAVDALRTLRSGPGVAGAIGLATAICLQSIVGILTLLHVVPIPLALLHQGMAVVVLVIAALHAERMTAGVRRRSAAMAPVPSFERAT